MRNSACYYCSPRLVMPSASSRWKIVDVKTIIINWMMNWIVFSVSLLQDDLRHKTVSYSEVQNLPVCFLCCYIPLQHSRSHFSELHSQPFPQKQVKMGSTESSCPWFYITFGPRAFPRWSSVANQDGGLLTYFDEPWKIEDLTKSKTFCGKISCIILAKKTLVLGALYEREHDCRAKLHLSTLQNDWWVTIPHKEKFSL